MDAVQCSARQGESIQVKKKIEIYSTLNKICAKYSGLRQKVEENVGFIDLKWYVITPPRLHRFEWSYDTSTSNVIWFFCFLSDRFSPQKWKKKTMTLLVNKITTKIWYTKLAQFCKKNCSFIFLFNKTVYIRLTNLVKIRLFVGVSYF